MRKLGALPRAQVSLGLRVRQKANLNGGGGVLTRSGESPGYNKALFAEAPTPSLQAGDIDQVRAVVDNLRLCSHLANVGDAKTLIIHPWNNPPAASMREDQRRRNAGPNPSVRRDRGF